MEIKMGINGEDGKAGDCATLKGVGAIARGKFLIFGVKSQPIQEVIFWN
jgi:hypothetical protein